MSKKKSRQGSVPKQTRPPAKKPIGAATWISGAIALVALVAVFAISSTGGKAPAVGTAPTSPSRASGGAPAQVSAEEQRYIGRLLPEGFAEPSVADATTYSTRTNMSAVTAKQDAKQLSVSVADVVAKKIVTFDYQKADGSTLPMIAYVKASGKLFVGVSFCPPCQGEGQRIEADGTLTCDACGTKRDLESGAGISGACKLYPLDELPATVKDGRIVLDNAAIDGWTAQPLDRQVG